MSTFSVPLNMTAYDRTTNATGYVMAVQYNTLTFADTTAKLLFSIPKPFFITSIIADVLVLFNSSGTDLLSFGTLATPTLLGSALDVSTTGRKSVSTAGATVGQLTQWLDVTDDGSVISIYGLFAQTVADATTGSARVMIEYACPKILNP